MADAPVLTSATFAAGCIAGAAGQLVGHPLDTIKVWAQTGSRDAVRLPFRALFRGIAGPIVSAGGVQSVRLGMYETFRRCWGPSEASTPLPVVGLSSASAGLVVSFILCPLHRVKVAQQLYGGGLYATARQLRREGSLYREEILSPSVKPKRPNFTRGSNTTNHRKLQCVQIGVQSIFQDEDNLEFLKN